MQYPAGIAGCNRVGWYVARHYRSGSYHCIVAYGYALQYDTACADEDVAAAADGSSLSQLCVACLDCGGERVEIAVDDDCASAYLAVIAYLAEFASRNGHSAHAYALTDDEACLRGHSAEAAASHRADIIRAERREDARTTAYVQ